MTKKKMEDKKLTKDMIKLSITIIIGKMLKVAKKYKDNKVIVDVCKKHVDIGVCFYCFVHYTYYSLSRCFNCKYIRISKEIILKIKKHGMAWIMDKECLSDDELIEQCPECNGKQWKSHIEIVEVNKYILTFTCDKCQCEWKYERIDHEQVENESDN